MCKRFSREKLGEFSSSTLSNWLIFIIPYQRENNETKMLWIALLDLDSLVFQKIKLNCQFLTHLSKKKNTLWTSFSGLAAIFNWIELIRFLRITWVNSSLITKDTESGINYIWKVLLSVSYISINSGISYVCKLFTDSFHIYLRDVNSLSNWNYNITSHNFYSRMFCT